ncbi:MAG: TCR/Tet family MFS transporter [Phycisphaerales bacterium]|nr:TCR/Tet family MFS transporter [Phycisphaerales bacterium]
MRHRPALGFIFFTLLLDVLGFGLLIPVAPKLVQQLEGGKLQNAAWIYGLLVATYSIMQFFFSPILGALSDRFGRRPVLLVALFGSGLDYFAAALAPNLLVLFITRAINGISGASFTVCNAYIADVTPPERRHIGFGLAGAAFGLGFVIGPLLGGLLGHYDIRYPFWAAGFLTLINWLYGYFVLPESLSRERREHAARTQANLNPLGTMGVLARYPRVGRMAAALFLVNLAMFGLHSTWVLFTDEKFGWSSVQVGLSLMFVGLGAAVVQGGLARKLIPALGERNSLIYGLGVGTVAYAAYALVPEGWMIYVVVVVASLGGICGPAGQAIITKSVASHEQGAVQGSLMGLQSIANILGPLIGTNVFAYFISDRAPIHFPGAPLMVSSVLAAGGTVIAVWATRGMSEERASTNEPGDATTASPGS